MSLDSFMQPEVYYGEFYSVETTCGTEIVPLDISGRVENADQLGAYVEGQCLNNDIVEVQKGWLARLSAPGYLDSTAWGAYDTEEEALADLEEMYGEE